MRTPGPSLWRQPSEPAGIHTAGRRNGRTNTRQKTASAAERIDVPGRVIDVGDQPPVAGGATPSVRYAKSDVDRIGGGNGDRGTTGVATMSSGLTPIQRSLLTRLLTTELRTARAAALAAGAHGTEVDAATTRRCRTIEAMIAFDTGCPEPRQLASETGVEGRRPMTESENKVLRLGGVDYVIDEDAGTEIEAIVTRIEQAVEQGIIAKVAVLDAERNRMVLYLNGRQVDAVVLDLGEGRRPGEMSPR
jgi:hypothetical protein